MSPAPQDAVELGVAQRPKSNRKELLARTIPDILLRLALSDGPAVLALMANYHVAPHFLLPLMEQFTPQLNFLNTATSVLNIGFDIRELRASANHGTRLDRFMDINHMIAGDVLSTAAGLTPTFTSLSNPMASAFFGIGQGIGIGLDLVKTVYDYKRMGAQGGT